MFKYGLKLWSTNVARISSTAELFRNGVFQYVELFAVPGTYGDIDVWAELMRNENIPFIIHAPHSLAGMNLANPASRESNMRMAEETFRFADALGAEKIIFHPGVNGSEEEAASQLKQIYDPRILVENKPYLGIVKDMICAGHSPDGIRYIMDNAGIGFCFDVGHAISSANALKKGVSEYINGFLDLCPAMFHLSDGDKNSSFDSHLHLGAGSYDLAQIVQKIPDNTMVTIETEKKYPDKLDDYIDDIEYLNLMASKCRSLEKSGIQFQKADMEDSKFILDLRNDPVARQMSFNSGILTEKIHHKWFMAKLNNPNCAIFVVKTNGKRIGQMRFDIDRTSLFAEISVALTTEARGRGYGSKALMSGCSYAFDNLGVKSIIAHIKKTNTISIKAFHKAGFIERTGAPHETPGSVTMVLKKTDIR